MHHTVIEPQQGGLEEGEDTLPMLFSIATRYQKSEWAGPLRGRISVRARLHVSCDSLGLLCLVTDVLWFWLCAERVKSDLKQEDEDFAHAHFDFFVSSADEDALHSRVSNPDRSAEDIGKEESPLTVAHLFDNITPKEAFGLCTSTNDISEK